MVNWNDNPYYRINKFVEQKLRDESLIPDEDAYNSFTRNIVDSDTAISFMIPGGGTPENNTVWNDGAYQNIPFCIYTVNDRSVSGEQWFQCGQLVYTFYSDDIDSLMSILLYLNNLLRREDWTAADVNQFYLDDATYPWEFSTVCFVSDAGPAPTDDEGGRYSVMLVLKYDVLYVGPGQNETITTYPYGDGLGMPQ